jgi:hypothetical protein
LAHIILYLDQFAIIAYSVAVALRLLFRRFGIHALLFQA